MKVRQIVMSREDMRKLVEEEMIDRNMIGHDETIRMSYNTANGEYVVHVIPRRSAPAEASPKKDNTTGYRSMTLAELLNLPPRQGGNFENNL